MARVVYLLSQWARHTHERWGLPVVGLLVISGRILTLNPDRPAAGIDGRIAVGANDELADARRALGLGDATLIPALIGATRTSSWAARRSAASG